MTDNKLSPVKTFIFTVFSLLVITAASVLMAIIGQLDMDELFLVFVVSICFSLVYVAFCVTKDELKSRIGKALAAVVGSFLILYLCYFVRDYFAPIMIIAVILTTLLNEKLALILGQYMVIIFCLCVGATSLSYIEYSFLMIFGVMLTSVFASAVKIGRFFTYVLVLCINVIVPVAAYYYANRTMEVNTIIYAMADGLVSCAFFTFIIPFVPSYSAKKQELPYPEVEYIDMATINNK